MKAVLVLSASGSSHCARSAGETRDACDLRRNQLLRGEPLVECPHRLQGEGSRPPGHSRGCPHVQGVALRSAPTQNLLERSNLLQLERDSSPDDSRIERKSVHQLLLGLMTNETPHSNKTGSDRRNGNPSPDQVLMDQLGLDQIVQVEFHSVFFSCK